MGPIKQVKPKELEEWLRKISPVAFVHIIKKSLKRVSTYLINVPLGHTVKSDSPRHFSQLKNK